MKNTLFPFIFLLLLLSSCADKYMAYRSQYPFRSGNGRPDYNQLDYWAAHPWKWDPSDSVAAELKQESRDTVADVFFLHPTTFTKKKDASQPNAAIDDAYINAKTDYSTILYQASVFNQHCRVFAPRYRQAHIRNFYSSDTVKSKAAFDLAYADIKAAFEYYLEHYNQGRPIIIAGHSQGALLCERLLKEFFEEKPLSKQLVVAYVIGWPVTGSYFTVLTPCRVATQTGCICSWRTFRKGYRPPYLKNEKDPVWVTNPLNWTTESDFVSRKQNKGALIKFKKLYPASTDAQIKDGLLYTRKPRFPWSFLYRSKNYHVGDINLYYINLRENIETRIRAFKTR